MPGSRMAVLTAHFGDPFWVSLLLRRVRAAFPEVADRDIYVIDQDRGATSRAELRAALGDVQILRYPRSEPHFAMTGHDHAHVLNLAVRDIDAEVMMLFDSDAHPTTASARDRIARLLSTHDALLAAWGRHGSESHPCFMVFGPRVDRERLFFDAHQLDRAVDTGREVYGQVRSMGLEATLLRPEPAFRGLWGTWYLDRTIYHHGSGSFNSSADARLLRQYATWRRDERFYRRRVARGEYDVGATTAALRGIRPRLTASATRGVAAVRRCVDQSHADRRNTS